MSHDRNVDDNLAMLELSVKCVTAIAIIALCLKLKSIQQHLKTKNTFLPTTNNRNYVSI